MTSLFVFFLIGFSSKNIFCLIVFDIVHIKVTQYGRVTTIASLVTVDIFTENKGPYEGCDVDFHPSYTRLCDIVIFTRLCMIDPKTSNQYTPDSFMNKHTFTVDENGRYTIIPNLDLNCGSIELKEFRNDVNNLYYREFELNRIIQPYSKILVFTYHTGDKDWAIYGKIFKYGIYAETTIGFKTLTGMIFRKTWTKYLSVFQTVMLQEYMFQSHCESNYHGKTCWLYCVDNVRHTCNCEFSYDTVPCRWECNPGWLTTYVIYEVKGVSKGVNNCILLDLCYDNTDCKFHCLPINNVTFACEKLLSSIRSNFHPSNITSDIFLYSELLTVSLDYDSLQLKDIAINTTISFNEDALIFYEKILSYKYGEKQSVFQVIQMYSDEPLDFEIFFNLKIWKKTILNLKIFRIYVKPTKIFLYKHDGKMLKSDILYIGEYLHCNSTAKPKYRVIYIWSSFTFKTFFKLTEFIQIPNDALIGRIKVTIKAILIIKGRPNEQFIYYFNPFIKAFGDLKWNLKKNVLVKTDFLQCLFKGFQPNRLYIFQLSGSTSLDLRDPQISLKDARGGTYYELICFKEAYNGARFSRRIKFHIKDLPSFVCLFLFTNTVGSIVQCSHDGYLYDDYNIIVSLNIFNSYWQVKIEGTEYIRIPYYMYFLKYMISCNITSKFNSTFSITHNKVYTLLENIQGRYDILKENRECPEFASYVEKPQISEYTLNEVIMKHFIFYLKDSDFNLLVLCILFLMFLLSFYSTSLILIIIFQHVNNKETVLRDRIEKQIKITRRGYLLKRLCHEAKEKVLFDKKYSSYSILKL